MTAKRRCDLSPDVDLSIRGCCYFSSFCATRVDRFSSVDGEWVKFHGSGIVWVTSNIGSVRKQRNLLSPYPPFLFLPFISGGPGCNH
jgi:hypothetical protein